MDKKEAFLANLQKTLEGGAVQPEEMVAVTKAVLGIVADLQKRLESTIKDNQGEVSREHTVLRAELADLAERITKVKSMVGESEGKLKSESDALVLEIFKEIKRIENSMPTMPDLEWVGEELAKVEAKIPKLPKEITSEGVRDKLESLEGDERLDAKAIKNLPAVVNQVRSIGGSIGIKGITSGNANATIDDDPTYAGFKRITVATSGGTVGPGTINEIAYFDSTTTVNSLAVATYPSLTELSYVKGVTSAIQTQLNAKQASITGSDTQVLFFDGANNPAGDAGFTYVKATDTLTAGVVNVPTGGSFTYNSQNAVRAQTALNNWYFGNSGNLTASGTLNTAGGYLALNAINGGAGNTGFGASAGLSVVGGTGNSAFGYLSGASVTSGNYNVSVGFYSYINGTGSYNVSIGQSSLGQAGSGTYNTAVGTNAMPSGAPSQYTTSIGANSLPNVTSGDYNTVLGYNTGGGITTGDKNTIIGAQVTGLTSTLANNIIIADGDGNKRIVVDSAGTVGIGSGLGTTIAGTAKALVVNNGTSTGNIFEAQDNGTAVFTIEDGGEVGVGGTPTTLLHVIRSVATGAAAPSSTFDPLAIESNNATANYMNFISPSGFTGTQGILFSNNTRALGFILTDFSAGTMALSPSGNTSPVLIGKATGTTKALVVNNGTSTGNIFEAQDNGTAVLTVADGGYLDFPNSSTFGAVSNKGRIYYNSGTGLTLQGDGTDEINLIDGTGNQVFRMLAVGTIAITSPGGTAKALVVNNGTSTGNIFEAQDNGTAVLTIADGGATTLTGSLITTPDTRTGAGAVSVTTTTTKIVTGGVADALTLADGVAGQIKTIVLDVVTTGGDTAVLTPTTKTGFTTVTFSAAGNTVTLQFFATRGWMVLGSFGAVVA